MIYGLIPVGGKGLRLGLPFPKELLPQKGFFEYKPLIAHTVEKMEEAGAELIYFIHGTELKQGIVDLYTDETKYVHIIQETPGFANVLRDFWHSSGVGQNDSVLFGLPDSIYDGNPFFEMIQQPDIVCGLFTTGPDTKVDRLATGGHGFYVKSVKTENNQDWFWGVIKFDGISLKKIADILDGDDINKPTEIGHLLNSFPKFCHIKNGSYTDLGTWVDYNKYLIDYKE